MSKGKLFFIIGLPRSGKSTWADNWVRGPFKPNEFGEMPNNVSFFYPSDAVTIRRPRAIISGDDFRFALHGHTYLPHAEGQVFASMEVATRALLSRGFDVVIDETCTTEATLLRYLRIDIEASPIWILTDVEECRRRAIATNKAFLVGPIERLAIQLERLRTDWDEVYPRLLDYCKSRLIHDNCI